MTADESLGIIVGSAFQPDMLRGLTLTPRSIDTPYGPWVLHEVAMRERRAFISFRHGYPHSLLPNHIPYRAQAWAFKHVQCHGLLVTSSVGVLDTGLPLFQPLLLGDLITLDNRLPDGSACSMFTQPSEDHGHLVLNEGLFSPGLTGQLERLLSPHYAPLYTDVIFGYVGGPRTKTRAENRMWDRLGAQVNSMTVAPEIILANELLIPCCAAVVGHKYSMPNAHVTENNISLGQSFEESREALARVIRGFLSVIEPVESGNHLYRYEGLAAEA